MDSTVAAGQHRARGECASPPSRKRFLAAKPSQVLYSSVTRTLTSMSSSPKLFKLHVITRIFFFKMEFSVLFLKVKLFFFFNIYIPFFEKRHCLGLCTRCKITLLIGMTGEVACSSDSHFIQHFS